MRYQSLFSSHFFALILLRCPFASLTYGFSLALDRRPRSHNYCRLCPPHVISLWTLKLLHVAVVDAARIARKLTNINWIRFWLRFRFLCSLRVASRRFMDVFVSIVLHFSFRRAVRRSNALLHFFSFLDCHYTLFRSLHNVIIVAEEKRQSAMGSRHTHNSFSSALINLLSFYFLSENSTVLFLSFIFWQRSCHGDRVALSCRHNWMQIVSLSYGA